MNKWGYYLIKLGKCLKCCLKYDKLAREKLSECKYISWRKSSKPCFECWPLAAGAGYSAVELVMYGAFKLIRQRYTI